MAGIPLVQIRARLRQIGATLFTSSAFIALVPEESRRDALMQHLVGGGYADEHVYRTGWKMYTLTLRGKELSVARLGQPLTPERTGALLDAFAAKVEHVNRQPYAYQVRQAQLFGGLATSPRRSVGTLCIAVHLELRTEKPDIGLSTPEDFAAKRVVVRALKDGSPHLQLFDVVKTMGYWGSERLEATPEVLAAGPTLTLTCAARERTTILA